MHLKTVRILEGRDWYDFSSGSDEVKRWSVIDEPDTARRNLLFQLIAICLGGEAGVGELFPLPGMSGVTVTLLSEPENPDRPQSRYSVELTSTVATEGMVAGPRHVRAPWAGFYRRFHSYHDLTKPFGDFVYVVVPPPKGAIVFEQVDPDFTPRLRSTRFGTLFKTTFPLTPPNAWLHKQYRRARYNSARGAMLYNVALTALSRLLPEVSFSHWDKQGLAQVRMRTQIQPLESLPHGLLHVVAWLFDFIRQLADSRKFDTDFRLAPGILIFPYHERLSQDAGTHVDLVALAYLFPALQFVLGNSNHVMARNLVKSHIEVVPGHEEIPVIHWVNIKSLARKEAWRTRNNSLQGRFVASEPAKPNDVVLVDVDSKIPNLALMKLSQFYKDRGRRVILCRDSIQHRQARQVFASIVFSSKRSQTNKDRLSDLHGDALSIGGPGANLTTALPSEVEALMPDYSLYPHQDFALGFLTRGCDKRCSFCLVPQKEGKLRAVAELDDLVPPGFGKLVLLDNDFLGHPKACHWMEEISRRGLQVNFNQSLDIRQVTPENALLLKAVKSSNYAFTRRIFFFSLNNAALIPTVKSRLELLSGIRPSEIRFVCMYGYDTKLADDIQRFSFLSSFGMTPFVQRYRRLPGTPPPRLEGFFDADPEALARIHFSSNGRIFENYLKWVSNLYFNTFGRVCMPLVDRIFRYNNKHQKHAYLAKISG
jgi:hypothetical protein